MEIDINNKTRKMKINQKLLTSVLSGLLVVSVAFIIWQSNTSKTVIKEKEIQFIEIKDSKNQLEKEHYETLSKLKEAEIKLDNLNNSTVLSNSEIKNLKNKIKTILYKETITKKELETANVMIEELNVKISNYLKENDLLKQDNAKLVEDKTSLQMENNQLVKVLDSTRVEKQNADDVIDLGSTLSISNTLLQGLNSKGKKTDVAEKIQKLRFSFVVNENRISSNGVKTVYFVLINPIGKEVQIDSKSGILSTKNEGEKIYTGKSELDYTTGLIKNVSFDVDMSKVLIDGVYKVLLYENGIKISDSRVAFRKKKILGFL